MLATPGPLPVGPQWAFEVKFDGIRLICTVLGGSLRLTSRNGRDLTAAFPELAGLADTLTEAGVRDATLDGELIARDVVPPKLQAIAPRIHRTSVTPAIIAAHPVTYMLFDVTRLDGTDLVARPWEDRRAVLTTLIGDSTGWATSPSFDDGAALWQATAAQGVEGVVAKRRTSSYQPGIRSPEWIKAVHRTETDTVVIGWRPESGGRSRVGALVLAEAQDGELRYVGSAGSGMTQVLSDALLGVLPSIARSDPAVAVPAVSAETRWVDPILVVSLRHLGYTGDQHLRHPVIVALRPDLSVSDLTDGRL
jgi:bifunctional non-homologous end joining protein LigD